MVMTRATFPSNLEPGLHAHFGLAYKGLNPVWDKIFEREKSNRAWEKDVRQAGFGSAPIKAEGGSVTYDQMKEGYSVIYEMITVALGFLITEEAIEDNLYAPMTKKGTMALARSMVHTAEVLHASVLNNATTTSLADGKTLLATDHPLLGSEAASFSNKLSTAADLSETALEQICIQVSKCVDDRNIPIMLNIKQLIIPPDLKFVATRILKSMNRVGTADNDINAIRVLGDITGDPLVWRYLTDTDAWFAQTDCPDGMRHFDRVKLGKKAWGDENTGNYHFRVRERYAYGVTDPRAVFGSEGA